MNDRCDEWIKYFPFKEPRPQQIEAINFVFDTFKSEKKFCLLEAPCGSGKSAIAITLARYYRDYPINSEISSAYIVTTQRILQDQYKKDFSDLANIWAKKNYECPHRFGGLTCDLGLKIEKALRRKNFESYYSGCEYVKDKKYFDTSDIGLTNLHFFLSHSSIRNKDQALKPRNLIVCDECHNLENVVVSYASLQFTKYFCEEILKLKWSINSRMSFKLFIAWVKNVYFPKLSDEFSVYTSQLASTNTESFLTSNSGMSLMRKIDELDRQIESVTQCLNVVNDKDWVLSISATEDLATLSPLYPRNYTRPLIFDLANKILLMSGTILDKKAYCNNIGIPENEAEFISLDSPFEKENRPIFIVSVGSLSRSHIDKTLPNVIHAIKELLDEHKNEKGIIHCGTYLISKYVEQHIDSDRLLFHSTDDRQNILDFHHTSKEPTVLVSPSFTEGVDLYDDLARFQIIIKVPFPYLGDNYIRTKMEKIPMWYEWNTAKTLVQASGRTIRNTEDHCCTYILDSDMLWWYSKNKNLLPEWWKDAIQK